MGYEQCAALYFFCLFLERNIREDESLDGNEKIKITNKRTENGNGVSGSKNAPFANDNNYVGNQRCTEKDECHKEEYALANWWEAVNLLSAPLLRTAQDLCTALPIMRVQRSSRSSPFNSFVPSSIPSTDIAYRQFNT